jgi:hypothetical protein
MHDLGGSVCGRETCKEGRTATALKQSMVARWNWSPKMIPLPILAGPSVHSTSYHRLICVFPED